MKKISAGFMLVEVLVALCMIAMLLLPLLSYQIKALRSVSESNTASLAQSALSNIVETLQVIPDSKEREISFDKWKNTRIDSLPNSDAFLSLLSDHIARVSLQWRVHRSQQLSDTFYVT